ncbi:MAG: anthranilate phosphoribosyltransferase [SAR324 cluster bacterium]|nr:anthranilate phosphoribosyltransferase [SAR324 cluster bacterium]
MKTELEKLLESPEKTMTSIIQRVATGPHMSKSISYDEARAGMRLVLEGIADPIQAAVFLIGLRVKRETEEENKGVLQGILDKTETVVADVDELVDIADPYNGYGRSLPSSPFLAVLLAEAGVPAVSHGINTVGPKFGVTHHQILAAAGIAVDQSVKEAAQQLSNPEIGWAYLDQSAFCPSLFELAEFRKKIVKRAAISTAEVLTGPIRGRSKTHLLTGYVHNEYPPIYTMLARHSGFNSALLLRGTEGGVTPSLRKKSEFVRYWDQTEDTVVEAAPQEIGIEQQNRLVPIPEKLLPLKDRDFGPDKNNNAIAKLAAEEGISALEGRESPTFDALLYSASLTLWHLGRFDSVKQAAAAVREILASGRGAKRFQKAAGAKK